MKYINQLDYHNVQYITHTANPDPERRAFGLTTTIAGSGCALCSAVMIADRLHIAEGNFGIEEARQLSYDCGANQKGGTMGAVYFPAFAEKFDLEMVRTANIEDMRHSPMSFPIGLTAPPSSVCMLTSTRTSPSPSALAASLSPADRKSSALRKDRKSVV